MTVIEAAARLGISPQAVNKAIRAGRLPARRVSHINMVRASDVETYKTETQPEGTPSKGRPKSRKESAR